MYMEDVYITAQELTLMERQRLAGMLMGDIERAAQERKDEFVGKSIVDAKASLDLYDISHLEKREVSHLKNQLNRLYEQADERKREGLPDCSDLDFEINCLRQEIRDRS